MSVSARTLTCAAALTFVAMTTAACGSGQQAGTGTPAGPTTQQRDQIQNTAQETKGQPRYDRCDWRDETKFVQILGWEFRGTDQDAALYLREAEKQPVGESFETVTLHDRQTCEVPLPETAQIERLREGTSTRDAFIQDLAKLNSSQRKEGFDITFDRRAHVAKVNWLFAPST